MKKAIFSLIVIALVGFLFTGCGVNSNVMFKEAKNVELNDSVPMRPTSDYKISIDDKITFTLTTKNGAKILEEMSGIATEQRTGANIFEFTVRQNGKVKLPIIGMVHVEGLTVSSCEDTLAKYYGEKYQSPFVQVRITNQRVIVFPGNGSDAKVVPLLNTNTTLMEAIAQAGGITDRGKANTVKLMRKQNGKRVVYRLDLSTIEGLKYVDMIVQANDYIYVEPTPELSKEISEDVVPIVSLFSSALVIFTAISLFK
ncbi:MAG: polysaccharide biosynthesis/export family protein [Crocinitomicaceae bacterium]|nr:polysaccharide biosynthesis/export family protein [Crocinitomicaceae bacterium]